MHRLEPCLMLLGPAASGSESTGLQLGRLLGAMVVRVDVRTELGVTWLLEDGTLVRKTSEPWRAPFMPPCRTVTGSPGGGKAGPMQPTDCKPQPQDACSNTPFTHN